MQFLYTTISKQIKKIIWKNHVLSVLFNTRGSIGIYNKSNILFFRMHCKHITSFASFYMTYIVSRDSITPTYPCAFAAIHFLVWNGGTFSWCENHWAIGFPHYILILSYCGSANVDGRLGHLTWLEPTWAISVDRKSQGTTSWFVIACQGFTF